MKRTDHNTGGDFRRVRAHLRPHALLWALLWGGLVLPAMGASSTLEAIWLNGGTIATGGVYQFSFAAKSGQTYSIGASTDLVHWVPLTNVLGVRGAFAIADRDASNFQQRFYQIFPTTMTNMVFIRPGSFTLGSPNSENGHSSTEGPQTAVTLTRGFWMGAYEVTQEEFVSVIGSNVSWFTSTPKLPADSVTWIMATNYCARLTQKELAAGRLPTGYVYRLPTEAEWEFACRAGTTTPFGVGNGTSLSSLQANFDGTFPYGDAAPARYFHQTVLPGEYPPNAWGLYDMHGNVWEWCQDWYGTYPGGSVTDPEGSPTGSEHVLRGGGFSSIGEGCRSAVRDHRRPGYASNLCGFRVVLGPTL